MADRVMYSSSSSTVSVMSDRAVGIVTLSHISDVLEHFAKSNHRACDGGTQVELFESKCLSLFGLDYSYSIVNNMNGELCNNYPRHIVVLEYEKCGNDRTSNGSSSNGNHDGVYQSMYDPVKLRDRFMRARFARCRSRFPLPVILYDGKCICRSATLSGGPEIYGRSGYDFLFSGGESIGETDSDAADFLTAEDPNADDDVDHLSAQTSTASDWQLFDRVRNQDIKLLKMLKIRTICDLMVENKKVKFGMNVTSSEKVDKEKRYAEFKLLSLPYPGCEFFKVFRDCGYNAEGLVFDWNQSHIDTNILVPSDPALSQLNLDWNNYKTWDLVRLTQNYLRLILKHLIEHQSGILVHCISGWDRTPLFISLLRLSLWADNKIHRSLGPTEILYLTLTYDWFLCGHNLSDRLSKGEEILFFCFYFLKFIATDEFSVVPSTNRTSKYRPDTLAEGLLLEEERRYSVCGSNSSLNSNCSSVSYRSQENPPQVFTNADLDSYDEPSVPSVPLANLGNGNMWSTIEASSSSTRSTTTPVAVPAKVRRRSDSGSSASCGSWQIISGTGSVRGSASTYDPYHTSSSDSKLSQSSLGDIQESMDSSAASSTVTLTSTSNSASRREKLQSVRTIFYSQYCALSPSAKNCAEQSGRLSMLFDQFAVKVGVRSTLTAVNRLA